MAERKYSVPPCVRYLVYWYWYTGIPLYEHTCILYTGTYMNGTHFICAHVLYITIHSVQIALGFPAIGPRPWLFR